jgi:hypothetical protein
MKPEEAVAMELDDRELQTILRKLEQRDLNRADLVALGRRLGLALLPPSATDRLPGPRELFAHSLAQLGPDAGLRVRLRLPPAVAAIPWEYIYIDRAGGGDGMDGFVALDPRIAIVRHEPMGAMAVPPLLTGDITVVAAFASAEGLPELDLAQEKKDLDEAIKDLDGIRFKTCDDATLDTLQPLLPGAGVFHFAGHGEFTREMTEVPGIYSGTGALAFDDRRVDAEKLGINLRGNGIRLVVLGGCQTGRRDGVSVWSGIAPALVKAEIPAVIGNQYSIRDDCAVAFSRKLYQALAGGLPLERAVTAGRIAAYNTDETGRDWGVAVLYMRAADGRLFEGAANAAVRADAEREAELHVSLRAKEVAAGAVMTGAILQTFLSGKVKVDVAVDGAVHGTLTGAVIDIFGVPRSATARQHQQPSAAPVEPPSSLRSPAGDGGAAAARPAARARVETPFRSVIDNRTRDFTGREWVFRKIDEFLQDTSGARVFLLTGDPGTGKTAIAARLAQMSLSEVTVPAGTELRQGCLAYFHFCQANVEGTLSPLTFVQSLSEALANRYSGFRAALESLAAPHIVVNAVVNAESVAAGGQAIGANVHIELKGADARPLFDQAVRRPLQQLATHTSLEDVVILIDSLDEALTFNADNNITQLLRLIGDFPPQVRFVLTCRSKDDRVFDLVGQPALDLITDAPPNLDEVLPYVRTRLRNVPAVRRDIAAANVAGKSRGNFLYAFHVVNDLIARGVETTAIDTHDLPDELEGVYRAFLERELATNQARWNDVYRPVLGLVAVARGDGLTKARLVAVSGLAGDTASNVLTVCAQYLAGGGGDDSPYRIYHQSFREFLLRDGKFTVFPAERHAAIARHLQDDCGPNWSRCSDDYALRYTPVHWAEAATLSAAKRDARTQALIELTTNERYWRRFESRVSDLPMLHEHVRRTIEVAALSDRDDMLPWLIKATKGFVALGREYLRGDTVTMHAEQGRLSLAEARLPLFPDLDEDWQTAARLILVWLAAGQDPPRAQALRDRVAAGIATADPLPMLLARVDAALAGQPTFAFEAQAALPLEVGQQLVRRIAGQGFDREMLASIDSRLMARLGPQSEMISSRGYAASLDAPILVNIARSYGDEGTALVDEYIESHAGYNYVQYRNRSLWLVLHAVLRHHPDQAWARERLRRVLVTALTGAGVEFAEMLPLTAASLLEAARSGDARQALAGWRDEALAASATLQNRRGANDSWGEHRRRLAAVMELYVHALGDRAEALRLWGAIRALPNGFAGFQARAWLRVADALRSCAMEDGGPLQTALEEARRSAHHIQDYHFCARITARCNALTRWHGRALQGSDLAAVIRRLAQSPSAPEFSADHSVGEPYALRHEDPDTLPIGPARNAATLEELVAVFQRPAVEFRRLNPEHGMADALSAGTLVHVPDPGLSPMLAVHLAARALADPVLDGDRVSLVRALMPVAAVNPTTLDSVSSYLLLVSELDDRDLLEDIVRETGPVAFTTAGPPAQQIGPDAVIPA